MRGLTNEANPRPKLLRRSVWTLAIVVGLGGAVLARHLPAQDKSLLDGPTDRRYSKGPLTPDDFQAEVPDREKAKGMTAFSTTDIKYDFRYFLSKKGGKLHGRVEGLVVFAVVLRKESWNKTPQDKALLDHEQGHFDLAQIYALRAQAELSRRLEETPLEATGVKELEVKQSLDREVRKLLRPFADLSLAANNDYDRVTRHGTLPEEQAQARKEQRELLKKLMAAAVKP